MVSPHLRLANYISTRLDAAVLSLYTQSCDAPLPYVYNLVYTQGQVNSLGHAAAAVIHAHARSR